MKAHLLYRDRDFDLRWPLPWNEEALTKDLALNTLFEAMAQGDKFVLEVVRKAILSGLRNDIGTIRYRQEVLRDCLLHPAVVRELYALVVGVREKERKRLFFSGLSRHPEWALRDSIEVMEVFLGTLKELRKAADSHAGNFASEGWSTFFAMLQAELTDEYLARVQFHLRQLRFPDGVLLSAGLGAGNKGTNYTLHVFNGPRRRRWEWLKWFFMEWLPGAFRGEWRTWILGPFRKRKHVFEFSIHPRDEGGARALAELQSRGISLVATALAQSADHVRSFFTMLETELAFYVGCVNLHEQLRRKGEPTCFPKPVAAAERRLGFRQLYDVCLTLGMKQRVVGNDADADKQNLVIITGANTGGKSTFLRSVGLAQLMMQCGLFVPAEAFSSSVYDGLFTHYKREEDTGMRSGKLDEELSRMSDIVDHIAAHSMMLFNESFAATNEREGSEIGRQIIEALLEERVKVVCVTHLYELAHGFHERDESKALFLRAERQAGGVRTFKLVEGAPLETSFGEDLYNNIFAVGADPSHSSNPTAHAGAS